MDNNTNRGNTAKNTRNPAKGTKKPVKGNEPVKRGALGVARRSIWYILRLLIIITVCLTLCYGALVEAMYVSNIYIIVTEGMEMRADCILGTKGRDELQEHFYSGWLSQDAELESGKYDAYRVDSHDYRLSIEKFKVYPWSKDATLRVVERVVNIQAVPYSDDNTEPAPAWQDSRMNVKLEKIEGRWYITELEVLELDPETDPRPTPDYSQLETDIPHY